MDEIHLTATVAENISKGKNLKVGQYSIIEENVQIGDNVEIGNWVFIGARTMISDGAKILHGTVIGTAPQHREKFGEKGGVRIGNSSIIREYVTIHRATEPGGYTEIGPDAYVMCFSHIGHDAKIGAGVVLTNLATIGGGVEIGDYAVIGGLVSVHQNIQIGTLAMVGGTTGVNKHIPPFATVIGPPPPLIYHINRIGMERRGIPPERIRQMEECYRILRRSPSREEALEHIRAEVPASSERDMLLQFLESVSSIAAFARI